MPFVDLDALGSSASEAGDLDDDEVPTDNGRVDRTPPKAFTPKPEHRQITVEELLAIDREDLVAAPFGRAFVWPDSMRRQYVDSAMRDGCVQPIVLSMKKHGTRRRYTVIDGWQRVSVLRAFRDGTLPSLSRTGNPVTFGAAQVEIDGPSRRATAEERKAFLEATLTLVVYNALPLPQQRDLFLRIHQTKPLDEQDRTRAQRGPFGVWLAELAAKYSSDGDEASARKLTFEARMTERAVSADEQLTSLAAIACMIKVAVLEGKTVCPHFNCAQLADFLREYDRSASISLEARMVEVMQLYRRVSTLEAIKRILPLAPIEWLLLSSYLHGAFTPELIANRILALRHFSVERERGASALKTTGQYVRVLSAKLAPRGEVETLGHQLDNGTKTLDDLRLDRPHASQPRGSSHLAERARSLSPTKAKPIRAPSSGPRASTSPSQKPIPVASDPLGALSPVHETDDDGSLFGDLFDGPNEHPTAVATPEPDIVVAQPMAVDKGVESDDDGIEYRPAFDPRSSSASAQRIFAYGTARAASSSEPRREAEVVAPTSPTASPLTRKRSRSPETVCSSCHETGCPGLGNEALCPLRPSTRPRLEADSTVVEADEREAAEADGEVDMAMSGSEDEEEQEPVFEPVARSSPAPIARVASPIPIPDAPEPRPSEPPEPVASAPLRPSESPATTSAQFFDASRDPRRRSHQISSREPSAAAMPTPEATPAPPEDSPPTSMPPAPTPPLPQSKAAPAPPKRQSSLPRLDTTPKAVAARSASAAPTPSTSRPTASARPASAAPGRFSRAAMSSSLGIDFVEKPRDHGDNSYESGTNSFTPRPPTPAPRGQRPPYQRPPSAGPAVLPPRTHDPQSAFIDKRTLAPTATDPHPGMIPQSRPEADRVPEHELTFAACRFYWVYSGCRGAKAQGVTADPSTWACNFSHTNHRADRKGPMLPICANWTARGEDLPPRC